MIWEITVLLSRPMKSWSSSSAKASRITLRILSPSDQDFSFLDSLQFFAKSGDVETLIAEKSGIADLNLAAPSPVLVMDRKDVELRGHVAAPSMSIIVRGRGRRGRRPPRRVRRGSSGARGPPH